VSDPHVEALAYSFVVMDEGHDYAKVQPWEGDLGAFSCRLEGGWFVARPQEHFSSESEARGALEPHLRAWEIRAELEEGQWIEFRFDSSQIVDREEGGAVTRLTVTDTLHISGSHTAVVGHSRYPAPANRPLGDSVLVRDLRSRLRDIRHRRERMLAGAYWFLTRFEDEFGGRDEAARQLGLSRQILSTLGRLAARNDPQEGRKVKGPSRPLTEMERRWILDALPRLALRAAVIAGGGPKTPHLTMGDFPPLR
jgi:hypothetical protein